MTAPFLCKVPLHKTLRRDAQMRVWKLLLCNHASRVKVRERTFIKRRSLMVHQYKLNGFNIVLDTCSGAVHVVDEVAYDVIEMYPVKSAETIVLELLEKYKNREDVTEEELRFCIEDVESLVKAKKLYTEDTFENMAGTFKERSGNVVKALCLHVAHTCNLNCSY